MSKIRDKALVGAINMAVSLRRKVVDCRFARDEETVLLDKTSELIADLERLQSAVDADADEATDPSDDVLSRLQESA